MPGLPGGQLSPQQQQHMQMMSTMMKLPTSAGDNGSSSVPVVGGRGGKPGGGGPLPASVTALFNAAAASSAGGSNACKWKPAGLDCSVGPLEFSSFFTDSGRVGMCRRVMVVPHCSVLRPLFKLLSSFEGLPANQTFFFILTKV